MGCGGEGRTLSDALAGAPCRLPTTNEAFAEVLQSKPDPRFLDIRDFGNGTDHEEFVAQASDGQLAELCSWVGLPRE